MAQPGTILASDMQLLKDALAALKKGKPHVVEDHIGKVLYNMNRFQSYSVYTIDPKEKN
jgi:hypothetical protein